MGDARASCPHFTADKSDDGQIFSRNLKSNVNFQYESSDINLLEKYTYTNYPNIRGCIFIE
ncbi:hypothetical protein YSY43_30380 [Paenibacillus sp. YSY-4.3]